MNHDLTIILSVISFIVVLLAVIFKKLKPEILTKANILKGYFIIFIPVIIGVITYSIYQAITAEKNRLATMPWIIVTEILGIIFALYLIIVLIIVINRNKKN